MNGGVVRGSSRGAVLTNHVDDSGASGLTSAVDRTVQIQNVKQTRVYVFGDADITEDEINTNGSPEMCELRVRGSSARGSSREAEGESEPVYLERTVTEDDTLQSVALQFGCPVAELKRINNLIRDQDFYAKRVIKVPVKRHGLLTELMEQENQRQLSEIKKKSSAQNLRTYESSVQFSEANEVDDDSDPESSVLLVRTLSIRDHVTNQGKEAQDFLKHMDKDLDKIRQNANSYKNSLDEVTNALTCKSIHPIDRSCRKSLFNGYDCGMRWWSLVIFMLIIVLGTPLLYFLYFYNHSNHPE